MDNEIKKLFESYIKEIAFPWDFDRDKDKEDSKEIKVKGNRPNKWEFDINHPDKYVNKPSNVKEVNKKIPESIFLSYSHETDKDKRMKSLNRRLRGVNYFLGKIRAGDDVTTYPLININYDEVNGTKSYIIEIIFSDEENAIAYVMNNLLSGED